MMTVLVRSVDDSRVALHEAGEIAARLAIQNVFRAMRREVVLEHIIIKKDVLGKPYGIIRDDDAAIAISISHSFPYALATALATDGIALGTDIERIRDFAPSTWEAFLTPEEKKIIAGAPPKKKKFLQTLSWSLKESVLKAFGTGLRIHPRQVDISRLIINESASNTVEISGIPYSAEARYWRVDSDFIATVVVLPYLSGYDWSDNQVWNHETLLLKL